jgi:predicted O-methyltransferase YrrM
MHKFFAFVFGTAISSLLFGADLPPPYDTVDLLPFNPQGWYANAAPMEKLIQEKQPKIVVEVGSWLGLSTRHIAKTIADDGVVYAIDHWLGSPNEDNSPFDLANLYRQFLSNVIHQNLTHKIIPVRMSSLEASRTLDVQPDLIYLDATHDFYSVYQDLCLWFPFVKGHGVLCGDDYLWGHDLPVQRAVHLFAQLRDLVVHHEGWFWFLEEK